MKILTSIFLILMLMPAKAATYYIDADPGGSVYDYAIHWDSLKKDKIIIRGQCNSSCTMVLGNFPNVCVLPQAQLGFHRAYYFTLFGYVTSKKATDLMWSKFPNDIKALINKNGGLLADRGGIWSPKMIYFRGSQLPKRYKCK